MSSSNSSSSAGAEIPVEVYRSSRHELMYLYVPAGGEERADLTTLPEALLERFGTPVYALSFELGPERKLAAADTAQVRAAIEEQGFYLQMPPTLHVDRTNVTPDARNPHEGR